MTESILIAIIGGICTAIPTIWLNVSNNDKTKSLIKYRLDLIEKKQEKHNCFIERLYEVEKQSSLHCEQIKVANHRIEDLEKKGA